jgi:hypothetical protein
VGASNDRTVEWNVPSGFKFWCLHLFFDFVKDTDFMRYSLRPKKNDVLEFKICPKKNDVLLNLACMHVHVDMQQSIST